MEKILKFVTSPAGKGVIRHALTMAGGFLAAKTWFNQTAFDAILAQLDTVLGAVAAIATAGATVWSVSSKKDSAPQPPAE